MEALYGSILRFAVRFAPFVLCACFALVGLAVTQFGRLPKQMFPLSERNQFLIYMNLPDGTDISGTEARALEVSRWLADPKQNPEIASHILYIGDGGPRFYLTLTPVSPVSRVGVFSGQHDRLSRRDLRRRPCMGCSFSCCDRPAPRRCRTVCS